MSQSPLRLRLLAVLLIFSTACAPLLPTPAPAAPPPLSRDHTPTWVGYPAPAPSATLPSQGYAAPLPSANPAQASSPRVVRQFLVSEPAAARRPVFAIQFDRAMDADSVAAALSASPAVAFDLAWNTQHDEARMTVREPLRPATSYTFTLTAAAADATGAVLTRSTAWQYRPPALLARTLFPGSSHPDVPVTFEFNYPIRRSSLEAAFRIEPEVDGRLELAEDGLRLTFTAAISLPHTTTFTIAFAGPLVDANGDSVPPIGPFTFTTPSPILWTSPAPSTRPSPAEPIQIRFDRPMDQAATAAALTIRPPAPGRATWDGTTLIFTPEGGYLAANTHYIVSVGAAARTAQGEALFTEPYRLAFQTGPFEQVVSFGVGPNAQVVDAGGRRAVQFVFTSEREYARIQFDLYGLTPEQFLEEYSSGFRGSLGEERREFFSTAGRPLVRSWEVDPAARPVVSVYGDWLAETLIPADVPPGAYVLAVKAGGVSDQLLLLLTHHTLVVKQAEGRLVTWVTDFQGAPADAEVGVYARNGERLAFGRTDAAGVFRSEVARDPQPLIVIAATGGALTAAGLGPEWRSAAGYWDSWWLPTPPASDYALYIYTDRPIYRPGQTVFFKAIVRQDADAVFSLPPAGTTLTARLRDARQNVVRTVYLFTNEFGTVSSLFRIADGAMLGDYAIELALNGESFRQTFKVQDYRKPDYAVTVTTDQGGYVAGDTVQVVVDSRYFFGEPVAGATVKLKPYELGPERCWEACSGEAAWYVLYDQPEWVAITDGQGRATFTLEAMLGQYGRGEAGWTNVQHSRIGLEATVDDGSRQAVSGFAVVAVFSAGARLSLDTRGYLKSPGETFSVQAAAHSISDAPLEGRSLTLQLLRWSAQNWEYSTLVQSWDARTGSDGETEVSLRVDQAGFYQLRLAGQDSRGRTVTADTWLYVIDEAARSGAPADRELSLVADRQSYAPGETANLLIESSFGGPALLTFERGTVRREQLVTLTPPFTRVPVTVQSDDAPNIVVQVSAWQPITPTLTPETSYSFDDSQLRTAGVNLSVPAVDKQLTVTLLPDQPAYGPRETATFRVRVTEAGGQPVVAEVSLALVDEAIFSLSQELSGPIFDAFYHERPALVRTFDALALERWLSLWGDGGRGGGDDAAMPADPRHHFPDTAIWEPTVVTDANGEAVLTLDLPDNLTRWRLTAKAVTVNHQVGEAYISVTTRQPIVIRPLLPRGLTVGDTFELSALVHNYTGAVQDVVVGLRTNDPLQVAVALTQTVRLAAGEQRLVGWPVAASRAGEALVTVYAETLPPAAKPDEGGGRDAVQLPLTIQPLAIPEVTTQVGELTGTSGAFVATLPLPAGALDLSTVRIELSRSIAGSLLTGLAYLTGFPYGCVEQTMSKALPNAVVGRAFKQLGADDPSLQADLPPKIDASVQRLYGFQHTDGGWGWWYDDDTDAYQTAWVVFGLAVTAQAGYEVDSGVIRAGAEWLTASLKKMDERTRAFALYSLAVAGYGDLAATRALARQHARLDTFSRAGLVLALHSLGALADADTLLDQLADTVVQSDGLAYWPDAQEDGHYRAKTMSSTTRSTALVLSALVAVDPEHDLIPGVVRYLMSQRQASGWGSTNETSFAILALTDYLLSRESGEAETGYTVELNGQVFAAGQLGRGRPAAVVVIPAGQLRTGDNVLRLAPSGAGRLYYVVTHRLYQPQAAIAAAGGIGLQRRYLDPATNRPITDTIMAGQLVRVVLTVAMPRQGAYMLVEDRLPGGLEALNEGLNTTSHDAVAEAYCYGDWSGCQGLAWRQYGYNNKEVRGDRVAFFITDLKAGRTTFSYLARATQAGEFAALPCEAYAMYDATLWGRSASDVITVAK